MTHFAASTDRPSTNRRFAESLELNYPVLSDRNRSVARAYGVLRLGLFAARHTFYIGPDGTILDVDRAVRPASAGPDMVERLRRLGVPPRPGCAEEPGARGS